MPRVTGIGGVFLRSPDPARLSQWYAEHLGIAVNSYNSATFAWSDEIPAGSGATAWAAFPADTQYFGSRDNTQQQVMINYRVDDLDALLQDLAARGVSIDPKRDSAAFGHFAWIQDCDGNRVELWQPLSTTT